MKNIGAWLASALALAVLAACGGAQMAKTSDPQAALLAEAPIAADALLMPSPDGRLPQGVTPTHYQLALTIDPRKERFAGEVSIRIRFDAPTRQFLIHAQDINATSAALALPGGQKAAATFTALDDGFARITTPTTIPAGEATLTIAYDAPFAGNAAGLYRAKSGGLDYAITQFQAIDARRAFPGFDEPRFKTPFDISVTAVEGDTAISNTREVRVEPAGPGMVRHVYAQTQKLPTYLLAFAVGPYDVVEGPSLPATDKRPAIPVRAVTVKGKGHLTGAILDSTPPIMAWFEDYFDTPYPYDKIDLIGAPEFAAGAMENAGAIVYAETRILMEKDAPVGQVQALINTHAHELAHQWFGDLVTPAYWDDIWLNESFATWMAAKATAAIYPTWGFDREIQEGAITAMGADSLSSARRIREPIKTQDDIEDAFDLITYEKGGGVLNMAESFVGEEAFREGVRLHMRRFPHGVATSKDFFESLGQGSGKPEIIAALSSFTDRSHVPLVTAKIDCAGAGPSVTLTQSVYQPPGPKLQARQWTIPACFRPIGAKGAGDKTCVMMTEATVTQPLAGQCPVAIMPNAGGAGYYRFAMDDTAWRALMQRFGVLSAAEQIAVLDSVRAGFANGSVQAKTLLSALERGAKARDVDVRVAAATTAESLQRTIPDGSARAYGAWIRKTFARPTPPKDDASPNERAAYATLARVRAWQGKDPVLRRQMLAQARGLVGLSDAAGPSPDLRYPALVVGVEDGGPEFFNALMAKTKASEDRQFQAEALAAMAATPNPATRTEFIETVVADQPFAGSQMRRALSGGRTGALAPPQSGETAWIALRDKFDQVLKRLPGGLAGQGAPNLAGGLCTVEGKAALEALFAANSAKAPGHERSLAQTSERIERCAAQRDARGPELAAALK